MSRTDAHRLWAVTLSDDPLLRRATHDHTAGLPCDLVDPSDPGPSRCRWEPSWWSVRCPCPVCRDRAGARAARATARARERTLTRAAARGADAGELERLEVPLAQLERRWARWT